ncbi:MAG: hypothetical protein V4616_04835, partial [Bacteroidota bacterium]
RGLYCAFNRRGTEVVAEGIERDFSVPSATTSLPQRLKTSTQIIKTKNPARLSPDGISYFKSD